MYWGQGLCVVGTPSHAAAPLPPTPTEALKTPEDRAAEQQILAQLLKVVDKRNALIHMQEEKRLSELHP